MTSRNASPSVATPPRLHVAAGAVDFSYGDLAADLAADYSLTLDDWQQLILDDWLAENGGRWAHLTCGLSVPRQNGKNADLEVRELFGTVGHHEKFLHTAHQVKTAQKHFRRLKHFFGKQKDDPDARFPELNALVAELRNVNGQEAVILYDTCQRCSRRRPMCKCGNRRWRHDDWIDGGTIELVARSQGSGRGFTVDVIVCDEAQDMSDEDQEALLSTSSASPLKNPQWIYTGTPPGPKAAGEVFTRIRTEIIAGAKRACWHEWSAEPEDDLDDPVTWRKANPGYPHRVLREVVEGERSSLSEDGFARERGGMWAAASTVRVIDEATWKQAADVNSMAIDRLALAVDVAPDRSVASVGFAGLRPDGTWHAELDEHRTGTAWIVPWVKARLDRNPGIRAVVLDAISPAASLEDDFLAAKIKVTKTEARDMASACGQFYDGISELWLHHTDQPQVNVALSVARKRPMLSGEAWGWNRKTATSDITPLVAATLALWGAQSAKVKKPRRGGAGGRTVGNRRGTVL